MLPLTDSDQQTLLQMAREALEGYLESGQIPPVAPPSAALQQPCGAFVSLHKGRNLRGCIGVTEAQKPLYLTVRECAVWAGQHDPRFPPVKKGEVKELNFEISVLSPLFDLTPDQVEVGRHGLMISQGGLRGLLLPQVATQWQWSREQFLSETCRKAGLPMDAWQRGAKVRAFTALIIEEPHAASSSHPAA